MDRMTWRSGVDIGGTFTDVALVEETSGRIGVAKVPTTPEDLAAGVLGALTSAMRRYEVAPSEVGLLSHATTVVTNAILEQRGARAALITTRGFRDVLELRRSARADLYDLFQDAPSTLIPRRRRFEITERIGADGAVVTPLADNEIDRLIEELRAARGAADRAGLFVVRCAARDQGVRAQQHDGRLCLCRAHSRLLYRAAGTGH